MLGAVIQVPPGKLLTVNAPASGPAWASGINIWVTTTLWDTYLNLGVPDPNDQGLLGLSKQNTSVVSFAGSWTSPAYVLAKGQGNVAGNFGILVNTFLQNASPINIGTNFPEPTGGLVNNNPTATKLKWQRRCGNFDEWYAVVPAGGLTDYTETIYSNGAPATSIGGLVTVWSGCAAKIFDDNFAARPIEQDSYNSASVTTAAGNVTILAAFRGTIGTAGKRFLHDLWKSLCLFHDAVRTIYRRAN